jgi:hypothetical protein
VFYKCKTHQRNKNLKTNSRNTTVKHIRGTKAWKQIVKTHQRNKKLKTNSRNTNVKHIRGTKT